MRAFRSPGATIRCGGFSAQAIRATRARGSRNRRASARPLKRIVERDRTTNETIYTVSSGGGDLHGGKLTRIKAIGLEVGHAMLKHFRIGEEDPEMAQAEVIQKTRFRRGAWKTSVETRACFSSNSDHLVLEAELTAYEDDERFFTRTWTRRIKRDLI